MPGGNFLFWAALGYEREVQLLHERQKDLRRTIDKLLTGGDLFRLGVSLVRDALTGIASAQPNQQRKTVPNLLSEPRPSFDSGASAYNWPPAPGKWNDEGRSAEPGELARLFFLLTYEELRIALESLILKARPNPEEKTQIVRAFNELLLFVVRQTWDRAQWADYWLKRVGQVETTDTEPPPKANANLPAFDLSVNSARAYRLPDGSTVLATGATINPVGAFHGLTATGNKAIAGFWGYSGLPLGDLRSLSTQWRNVYGNAGPFAVPPEESKSLTPYFNVLVDFGAGDFRILVMAADGLNDSITSHIGSYTNVANLLTYSWVSTQGVLVVGSPVPGSVPFVSVGASWLENAYRLADLIALRPQAKLVDRFPEDNGFPAGCIMPAVMVCSGDSNNTRKSGKHLVTVAINGATV